MTDDPDARPVQVQLIEANGRWAKYEESNKADHEAIISRLGRVDVVVGILKVLGVLVLALIGTVAALIIGGANWINTLQDEIHDTQMEARSNDRGNSAIDRSLQKEINELMVDMRECQRVHRRKPDKD